MQKIFLFRFIKSRTTVLAHQKQGINDFGSDCIDDDDV